MLSPKYLFFNLDNIGNIFHMTLAVMHIYICVTRVLKIWHSTNYYDLRLQLFQGTVNVSDKNIFTNFKIIDVLLNTQF